MNQILEHLYLTDYYNAKSKDNINSFNIKFVVNCTYECENVFDKEIDYFKLFIDDNEMENIYIYFDKVADLIHKYRLEGKNVLVHCLMGISRSSSIIIAYLIKYHNMNFEEAYNFVKSKRNIVNPNKGFRNQLMEYYDRFKQLK